VAFARVLTDRAFKALILDVIVAEDLRGEGLGRALVERIICHPDLEQVRHLKLYCLPDLVPFYERWGFSTDVSGAVLLRRNAEWHAGHACVHSRPHGDPFSEPHPSGQPVSNGDRYRGSSGIHARWTPARRGWCPWGRC